RPAGRASLRRQPSSPADAGAVGMKREQPSAHAGAELEQLHNDCKRWRNDFSALPLPVWGEGWGEGVTELSRGLNPSPRRAPLPLWEREQTEPPIGQRVSRFQPW